MNEKLGLSSLSSSGTHFCSSRWPIIFSCSFFLFMLSIILHFFCIFIVGTISFERLLSEQFIVHFEIFVFIFKPRLEHKGDKPPLVGGDKPPLLDEPPIYHWSVAHTYILIYWKVSGVMLGVISKTFNKGGSRGNVMKKGCGFLWPRPYSHWIKIL